VPNESRSRIPILAAVVVALVAAVVAVLLLAGGDDDEPTVSRPSATHPAAPTQERPANTETKPTARRHRPSNQDAATIQRTVTRLVQANEQGAASTVCRLLGQAATGTGLDALQRCASRAGVDLSLLPTSDELSVGGIHRTGDRATASPAPGTRVSLVRSGRGWKVTGIRR
jgi:hypothetical protein